jgi:YD repeat-containing protein
MKQIVLFICFTVVSILYSVDAAEPNYIRTTTYDVGGSSDDIIVTDYYDGTGKVVQNKQLLSGGDVRVVSSFYNSAGKLWLVTKPYIDLTSNPFNLYSPGTFTAINAILDNNYNSFIEGTNTTAYAYSETEYYNDPLGRTKRVGAPGASYGLGSSNYVAMWYFGVKTGTTPDMTLVVGASTYIIKFENGFITAYNSSTPAVKQNLSDEILDELYISLHSSPIFNADCYLTVTRDPKGKYSQELKSLFEKTIATNTGEVSDPIVAKYEFDILGKLETEIAPKNGAATLISDTRNVYNSLGQLIKKTTADGGTFGYAYTLTGQLASDTSYIEGSGTIYRIRRYRYDALDRLISTEVQNVDDSWTVVLRNYYQDIDELSVDAGKYNIPQRVLLSLKNTRGRIVASVATNDVGGLSYYVSDLFSYDNEGRISTKIKVVPGMQIQEINYTYDLQGKLLTDATECGAQKINKEYEYNSEGLLEDVIHTNNLTGKTLATYGYDDFGKTKFKTLGLTVDHQLAYAYTIRDWLKSIGPALGNRHVNTFTETINQYEPNGNIQNALYNYGYLDATTGPEIKGFDLTYSYDNVNRLTGVAQGTGTGYGAAYTYDQSGRFKSKQEGAKNKTGYRYYNENSRLKNTTGSDADEDYLYDKQGNLVIDKSKKMVIEYNFMDMPIAFRFYDIIPTAITSALTGLNKNGQYTIATSEGETDLYRYMAAKTTASTDRITLRSQVVMLYDASGNRVMKMEVR